MKNRTHHSSSSLTSASRETPLSAAAAGLVAEGRVVFPVRLTSKKPLTKWGQLEPGTELIDRIDVAWRYLWRRSDVGIGMRTGSGLIVVDLDPRNCGADDPEAWLATTAADLPVTRTARTRGGGRHLYFTTDAHLKSKPLPGAAGIDIKAEGGFVIVPPSPGYEWVNEGAPIAALPEWLEQAAFRDSERGPHGEPPVGWKPFERHEVREGGRNDYLARAAGWLLRSEVAAPIDLEDWLQYINDEDCKPPLDGDEVAAVAASIARYDR